MDYIWKSKDSPLVFIGIPKNAGTSIIRTLSLEKLKRREYTIQTDDILFAVTRDPFTRIVSAYIEILRVRSERSVILAKEFYKCQDDLQKSFQLFLDDLDLDKPYNQHIRKQVDFLVQYKHFHIEWLDFETLEEDFAALTKKVYGTEKNLMTVNECVDNEKARLIMKERQVFEGQIQAKYYDDYELRMQTRH
jgi:hypothetical protein